jgi:tetratricopeptide (TPR) repeat protein
MLAYYIIVTFLIIITSYLLNKYRSNWKYISVVITILTFLCPRIYDAFTLKNAVPDFNARINQYDLVQDSIFLKFEIENIGTADATNIWHITTLNENLYGDNLKIVESLAPNEECSILSLCRYNTDIEEWMTPILYLGYDYKQGRKTKTVYKRFKFLITNSRNSGSCSTIKSTEPKEISGFEALFDSLSGIRNRLSMRDGSIFMSFRPIDFNDNPLIAMSEDKRILFNTVDSNVYFERPYNEQTMIVISSKINKNYNRGFHTFLVSWSDSTTFLIVDNQELVKDDIIRKQLSLNPAMVFRDYGINWFNKKDYFNAIRMLNKSLELDKRNHFITYEKLFLSYEETGLINTGIDVLKKAIDVGHLDSSILLNLAIAYENNNENKKASEIYTLDHRNSKSLTGFLNHINLHNSLGNYQYSLNIIQQAKDLYPNNSQLCNNTGITCLGLGDSTLALQFFAKAIKLDVNNENAKNNYDLLFTKLRTTK